MDRFAVKFNKTGYIKYTSHLDMTRLFKRMMKLSGVDLKYSNGYNPHPKMVFANPLPLGYESLCEYVEIETKRDMEPEDVKSRLNEKLPEGLEVLSVTEASGRRNLASRCLYAEYRIYFPIEVYEYDEDPAEGYMDRDEVIALKRQKKTGEMVPVDIKGRILAISGTYDDGRYIMELRCDLRNDSMLSPEPVISSFLGYTGWDMHREDIEVLRTGLVFIDNQEAR